MDETDRPDDRRAAGSWVLPNSESPPSKESRSRQIRNPKTQENQDLPTAFLQNRILAHVKSQRRINRFRILHGRLESGKAIRKPSLDPEMDSTPQVHCQAHSEKSLAYRGTWLHT